MFSYIKGQLAEVQEDAVVVETGGIGFHIRVPGTVRDQLPSVGCEIKVYTHFRVSEDSMSLYGFLTRDDLEAFRLLLGVSGVGPKAALGVLSVLSADDLRFAVLSDDAKAIAKAPGLGPKTARKIILELKDKMDLEEAFEKKLSHEQAASPSAASSARDEAMQALVALGYSSSESLRVVRGLQAGDDMDAESILKLALKQMSFI